MRAPARADERMTIDYDQIGFRDLKELLVACGVPNAEVRFASDKRHLRAIVARHPACGIDFVN